MQRKRKGGAPETIRTSDLALRRRLLYPTELPGLKEVTIVRILLRGASYGGSKRLFYRRLLALRAPAKRRYPLRVRSAKARFGPPRTHPTELPGLKEVTIVRILLRGASYGGASGYFIGAYSPCGRRQSGGIRFAFVRPKHALAPPALTQLSYRG
jgi:hypothetical protein